jgi:hypothetical protein
MTSEERDAFGAMAGWERCLKRGCGHFVEPWTWPNVEAPLQMTTVHQTCWIVLDLTRWDPDDDLRSPDEFDDKVLAMIEEDL